MKDGEAHAEHGRSNTPSTFNGTKGRMGRVRAGYSEGMILEGVYRFFDLSADESHVQPAYLHAFSFPC